MSLIAACITVVTCYLLVTNVCDCYWSILINHYQYHCTKESVFCYLVNNNIYVWLGQGGLFSTGKNLARPRVAGAACARGAENAEKYYLAFDVWYNVRFLNAARHLIYPES